MIRNNGVKAFLVSRGTVAASCHFSLYACSRSLFASGLSIDSRAYVISQHAHWPIRTRCPTCPNQDAWVAITPKRPKANSIHTAVWHVWTRTLHRNTIQKTVFSLMYFPDSFILFWPSCYFGGIETWLGVVRRTSRNSYRTLYRPSSNTL